MNQIFKIKRNALGQSVVTSELAKSKGKIATVAAVVLSSIFALQAQATPVSIQGTATSENAVAIGTNSFATAVDGVAGGQGAIATGQGFNREDFAAKVKEVEDLTSAKNAAESELNNLNNDKATNDNTQKALNDQIADATQKMADAADKINQKNDLTNQKDAAENNQPALDQKVTDAQNALNDILKEGKNLYLLFTPILQRLDYNQLTQPNGRTNLATELKTLIETDFPEFAGKYEVEKYGKLIDGYVNKQAGYEGSAIAINNTIKNSSQRDGSHPRIYDGSLEELKNIDQLALTNIDYMPLNKENGIKLASEVFGYPNGGVFDDHNGINSRGGYVDHYVEHWNPEWTMINSNQKTAYNSVLLAAFSKTKLINDGVGDYIGTALVNSSNNGTINPVFNGSWLSFKVKTTNAEYIDPFVKDSNLSYINSLINKAGTNDNTLTVNEIQNYTNYYNALNNWYNSVDWNDPNAAYDLVSYKAQMDKTVALANKINNYNTLYTEILNERGKISPDQSIIDSKTAELLNLYKNLTTEKDVSSNLLSEYRLTLTDKANEYLNYAKTETDATLNRMAKELILYDKDDAIVVDVTNKAKELQDALDNAKKEAEDNQAVIDDLTKQIDDIGLTPEEEAAEQTKKDLEDKLQDAKDKQAQIDSDIADKTQKLDELKDKLANSPLKDLGLRSQAHGSNAFASGNDSIAMGTNATVTSNDGIAIGRDSNVTGTQSIAIGAGNTVSGNKSIAIGVGHTVSGNRSGTFGDPNVVKADDAYAFGNNNTLEVGATNTFVLGHNVVTDVANSVALGANTTLAQAVGTPSIEIDGTTYNFAGVAPVGTVSVGAADQERTITNVGAGRISDVSTDAINGSQLYAVVKALADKPTGVTTEEINDVIDGYVHWNVNTANYSGGEQAGDGNAKVANKQTVTFDAGKNVSLTQSVNADEHIIAIATKDDVEFNNVTINNAPTENNHATTKKYVDDGRTEVVAGKNVTVDTQTDDATGKTTYTVNANAPKTTVTGSDSVKVDAQTDDVTGNVTYTLTAPTVKVEGGNNVAIETKKDDATGDITFTVNGKTTEVVGGKNVTIDTQTDDATGKTTYTVNANAPKVNLTAGDNVKVDAQTDDATGEVTYKLSADKTTVTSGAGIAVKTTTETGENGSTTTNYEVSLADELKAQIAKEESVTAGSTNLTVKQDGQNDTGGKNFVVDLAKNIDLTQDGSLTIGGVKLSAGDINMGGNTVQNVAAGVNDTDAVNVKQLKDTQSIVEAGEKVTVDSKVNEKGATVYTVNALTSEVKGDTNITVEETKGDKGQSVFTTKLNKDVNLTEAGSLTIGDVKLSAGDVNMGGNTVQNVAAGVNDTDAVNVKQLKDTQSVVKAGEKVTVTSEVNEKGATVYTVNALTTEVKAGNNVKVAETKGDLGQSIFDVTVDGDLNNITSVSNGGTKITLGDNAINVNNARVTNVAAPTEATDAVNKDYVDNSHTTVTSNDGSVKVVSSVTNATTGATNYDLSVNVKAGSNYVTANDGTVDLSPTSKAAIDKVEKGLNTATDDGLVTNHQLGDTVSIKGDDANISTATDKKGAVRVKLADNVKVKSVTTGKASMSEQGVNAGDMKVTNVAAGDVHETSTDAVNGSQLHATNVQVRNNAQNIQNLNGRVANVEQKVDRVQKQARKGVAAVGAMAMLPQPHISGKSMVSAAATNYRGEQALAVGYSRLSDNGKHIIKISGASNVSGKKEAIVGAAYGYQW